MLEGDRSRCMPILDCHTHFFPEGLFQAIWRWFDEYGWNIRYKIPAEEVVTQLQSIGVQRMVLLNYAHKPGMSLALNQWTYAFAKKHPEILPFGTLHPHDEKPLSILHQCFHEFGFYGIKLHAHVLGIAIDDPVFFPIYEKIEEEGKVLTLHAGTGPSLKGYSKKTTHVAGAHRVSILLKRFPRLKLIIPHLGADEYEAFFDLMEEHPHLWMDTTMTFADYFPRPPLERISKLADRLLYGSDTPNIPYELGIEIRNIQKWLPHDIQEKIFWTNAHRLFEITEVKGHRVSCERQSGSLPDNKGQ